MKSDGCRAQYKGRRNFFELSRCHLRHPGVAMWHDFPASHHYSGPHDNAGKTPRIMMQEANTFGKVSRHVYVVRCTHHMP